MTAALTTSQTTTRRAWIAWTLVSVIWGTTYLAIKIALETIPPFLMGGLRYVIAGVALAAWIVARGGRLPARADWGRLAVLSFFMLLFGNGGVVWGEQFISSGLTAVLIGTSPFWMVTVDRMLPGGGRMHARQWLGLVVGFIGILILVWPEIAQGGSRRRDMLLGVIAVQIACAGWAVGSAYTRRHVMPADVLGSAALQMLFGGAFMLIAATVAGEWPQFHLNPRTAWSLVYLTILGSVVAFAAYSYTLQHMDVAIVSLYSYVNPVIAVVLGILVLGEPFGVRTLIAIGVIVAGVLVVGRRGSEVG